MKSVTLVVLLGALALSGCVGPTGEADAQKVRVTATEWDLELSRSTFAAGEPVTFVVRNEGSVAHDFGGDWGRTKTVPSGEQARLEVTFDGPGEYAFWCNVSGHREAGMEGLLRVE